MNTVERATGRWQEILPQLGIAPGFLVNRHGPCPLCGGRDRYRFDDRNGSGSYFCNQCGAGTGIILVRKANGWDHKAACDAIDRILGHDAPPPRRPERDRGAKEGRLAKLQRVLDEARDPAIVERYLADRGLSAFPGVLRGHPGLTYVEGDRFVGRYPAMVAPVLGPDGRLQSVHRTYLAEVPTRKKLMTSVDTVRGGAVRMFEPTTVLGVAEGIETAIAAHELSQVPTWAAISTSGMESFLPPAGIERLYVFADNDANGAGQTAAYGLAHRLARKLDVRVEIAPTAGTDWADVLVAGKPAA